MNFTERGREKAHKRMEQSLTDLQRLWRSFASGRPPEFKLDAVNVLSTVCNLRSRLEDELKAAKRGEITSVAIAYTADAMPAEAPGRTILLIKGKEDEALGFMLKHKTPPRLLGAFFAVRDGKEKRLFTYPLDRSENAVEILDWLRQRQLSGVAHRSTN